VSVKTTLYNWSPTRSSTGSTTTEANFSTATIPSVDVSARALLPYPAPKPADESVVKRIEALWQTDHKFVVLSGPPGTGKTRAAEDAIAHNHFLSGSHATLDNCRLSHLFPDFRTRTITEEEISLTLLEHGANFVWEIAVMHPQYTYEDLIRGYRLESSSTGTAMGLKVREGSLGFIARVSEIIQRSEVDSQRVTATLLLDEFNRAPIGQLFGEALYALDRRGVSVATPYTLESYGQRFSVPQSTQILGTMNSVDRSTNYLDLALRRRFTTLALVSNRSAVENAWSAWNKGREICLSLYDNLQQLVSNASREGDIQITELVLGQSYFLAPKTVRSEVEAVEWLAMSYVFKMLPTLRDYEVQGLLNFSSGDLARLPGNVGVDYQRLASTSASSFEAFRLA